MQKTKPNKTRLGREAQAKFDKAVAAVYDGIVSVSQLRQRDKVAHSMSQSEWDCMYVERAFALMAKAISADIHALTDALAKQAQTELEALKAAAEGEKRHHPNKGCK
jgi:hypothetical protein